MKSAITVMWVICSLDLFRAKEIYLLDESWVCNVKNSCVECLRLPHCSWCNGENRCFSKNLPTFEEFCKNNVTDHQDFGLSLEDNAQCGCAGGELERHCYPPGVIEGSECSGRGECICGRCACNSVPDPNNLGKTVMGEFCEFDNFSCDGPKCNEGPYSLNPTHNELSSMEE